MPEPSPDALLFDALVASRPAASSEPSERVAEERVAVLVLRLADSVRHLSSLLRDASVLVAGGNASRLPDLLAQAEIASLEQAACARGLLEALARPEGRRAA